MSNLPIHIEQLAHQIDQLKANDGPNFSLEFESVEACLTQQFTCDHSRLDVNKPKNRYPDVIAYDHSRVILSHTGAPGSDYINANYVDGFQKPKAYIATQGPLPETIGDFWRMIWEKQSPIIVMMGNLDEGTKNLCDQYWPNSGTEHYGLMTVTLAEVTEFAIYTIRTFQLEQKGRREKKVVQQFQFTAWPDHGVPEFPTALLMFMRRVNAMTPLDPGPIVVHYSSGIGRTGVYIVVDAMLSRMESEKTVAVYGHVTNLRSQRMNIVQTEEQYIFIHDALLEAVTSGHIEIPATTLDNYIKKITQPLPGETVTQMELEFKKLSDTKVNPSKFMSANLPVNKPKNRRDILPYESTRVCLQPIEGVDGSDYINASFIDGYRYRKAYIATQGPLAETTEDFWRMLWEHNSTIIVMLTKLSEMGEEMCHQYWPSEKSACYKNFVVEPTGEFIKPQFILRQFEVKNDQDGQSRTIRQFQFTNWPEEGVPKSGEDFIDFVCQMHKSYEQFNAEGPMCVHCSDGAGRTGVFITLEFVHKRMESESVVDIFQTCKLLRTQRPGMIQTEDQYDFCYREALKIEQY